MKKEDKDLLLKDICGRLPYGVKVESVFINPDTKEYKSCGIEVFDATSILMIKDGLGEFKPYLFPLSSMTEEQREELYKIGWYLDEDKIYSCFRNYDDVNYKTHIDCFELINWCYKNNFDINGLIPMGLAIDATDKNIY